MLSERDYMHGDGGGDRTVSCIWPIIVLNIIVFLCCELCSRGDALQELISLHPYYIRHFQLWRLVTYMFAHVGAFHILCNLWAVYLFGRGMEQLLGCRRFLTLYFLSGILGGLCWCLFNWNNDVTAIVSQGVNYYRIPLSKLDEVLAEGYKLEQIAGGCVGASGGVFGLLTATALAFPDVRVQLVFPPVSMKMRTFAIIYICIEIVSLFNVESNVAHIAHLGGALGALIYMRRLCPQGKFFNWLFHRRRKPIMHVITNDPMSAEEDEFMSSPEVARVMQKFSKVGRDGLTDEERAVLIRVVQIMTRRHR